MITLILLLLSLAASPFIAPAMSDGPALPFTGGLAAQVHGCPPAHPRSEGRVRTFLTNPLLPEVRARFNLGTASVEDVRVLTDERDRETCNALWTAIRDNGTDLSPGDHVSFYRSGDTFFVPISRSRRPSETPGTIQLLAGRVRFPIPPRGAILGVDPNLTQSSRGTEGCLPLLLCCSA